MSFVRQTLEVLKEGATVVPALPSSTIEQTSSFGLQVKLKRNRNSEYKVRDMMMQTSVTFAYYNPVTMPPILHCCQIPMILNSLYIRQGARLKTLVDRI